MKFKAPFVGSEVGKVLGYPHSACWPCITVGWLYIRFLWELVEHKTVALGLVITEEALNEMFSREDV